MPRCHAKVARHGYFSPLHHTFLHTMNGRGFVLSPSGDELGEPTGFCATVNEFSGVSKRGQKST
jgi:hypothetical protein